MLAELKGSIVALVTPMTMDGAVDFESLGKLVNWHIENGTAGLVVLGTTGEAATITAEEKLEVFDTVVKLVKKRIPVIAGTGTNCTATTIDESRAAAVCKVDACLIVTPYYNKPTQEGMYQHYKTVAEKIDLPIITYNVPSRTGCDLLPETMARLADYRNIIGIKEATGDVVRVKAFQALVGDRFRMYSGDDKTAMQFMQAGGHGVISVTANICPKAMQELCISTLQHDFTRAEALNSRLAKLHTALMVESNPIPAKWALAVMGRIANSLRLPLTPLSQPYHSMLVNALADAGVTTSTTSLEVEV